MLANEIEISPAWRKIDYERLHGTVMVIGAPDVGKTTFVRYLFSRLLASKPAGSELIAFLDGDPGQSTLGPPATLSLVVSQAGSVQFPPQGKLFRLFVGSVTPRGHMLPTLVAGARLVQTAEKAGASVVIYDTCGLVDPAQGGLALKAAKIELLHPTLVFAIQRGHELEPLLAPFRLSRRVQVVDLEPSPATLRRDAETRRMNRAAQFAVHFANSQRIVLDWMKLAVFPYPRFILHQLAAFEDEQGFTLGLAIVVKIDRFAHQVTLLTPLPSLEGVNGLRLGDLGVDPDSFVDRSL